MAHIKFLSHGTGSAKKAVQYLTGPKEGRKETILRGDPYQVAIVADTLTTRYRYSSAVIGFAPEDAPTPEQIDRCLEDFRKAMGPGLEESRLAYTAIRHDEPGNRIALHILCARVDLFSGKSFNPAPPGWQKRYDPLRDAWNYENGWARPDDPERARLFQPGHRAFIEAENLRKGVEESDDPKKLIAEYLTQRIEAGVVSDRTGVIESLKEAGFEINRQGQDYVSIKDKESGQKIRLKGVIYAADFSTEELEGSGDPAEGQEREGSTRDPERSRECRLEFEERLKRISEYNQKRYRRNGDKEMDLDLGRDLGWDVDPSRSPLADREVSLVRDHGYEIGTGTVESVPGDRKHAAFDIGKINPDGERALDRHRPDGGDLVADAPRSWMGADFQDGRRNGTVSDRGEVVHDGSRENIDGRVRTLCRRSGAVGGRERSSNSAFEQSSRRFRDGIEKVSHHAVRLVEKLSRNLGRIKEWTTQKIVTEMKRFKKEVNLAEFLRKKGYTKEKGLGKVGIVLKGPDGERILVATSMNNHGVYFNVHDDSDAGSVIEFLMRGNEGSFRSVYKELRAWLNTLGATWRVEESFRPLPSTSDQQKILLDLAGMSQEANASLMKEWQISSRILVEPRFSGQILTDHSGNAVFPHFLKGQLTGYEIETGALPGFATKGEKGLWFSHGLGRGAMRITICQSGLDCLSHAQMHPNQNSDYVSIAGSLSDVQKADLGVVARMASMHGIEIVVAVGNDPLGEKLVGEFKGIFQKEGVEPTREIPENGKGWKENLQQRKEKQACPVVVAKVGW